MKKGTEKKDTTMQPPSDSASEGDTRRRAVAAIKALAKGARGMSAAEILQARDEGRR
jgi:hypothetical protein